jgi:hypothetical protein
LGPLEAGAVASWLEHPRYIPARERVIHRSAVRKSFPALRVLQSVGKQAQEGDVLNRPLFRPFGEIVSAWIANRLHGSFEYVHHAFLFQISLVKKVIECQNWIVLGEDSLN